MANPLDALFVNIKLHFIRAVGSASFGVVLLVESASILKFLSQGLICIGIIGLKFEQA